MGAGERMRHAMWYGGDDVRLEERAVPVPQGDEVLVRVSACGLCATDLHSMDGSISFFRPPRVLGHEVAGVVAAVGPAVRSVGAGEAVALDTSVSCGVCLYCREGKPFLCTDRRATIAGF